MMRLLGLRTFEQAATVAAASEASVGLGRTLGKAIQNGREWLRAFWFAWRRCRPGSHPAGLGRAIVDRGPVQSVSKGPGPLQRLISRLLITAARPSYVEGRAARVGKDAAKQALFGQGRPSAGPVLALVGFSLASGDGLLTHRHKLETVCEDVRIAASPLWAKVQQDEYETTTDVHEISLQNLHLGKVIAKGCNAIVHAARWHDCSSGAVQRECTDSERSSDSGTESSIEVFSSEEDTVDGNVPAPSGWFGKLTNPPAVSKLDLCKPFGTYDLAVKMMFNYDAESNAPAILRAMYKEVIPAQMNNIQMMDLWENGLVSKTHLPPHPNIVDLKCAFADSVPQLPEAMSLYPDALPRRLNLCGAGRNMTLFLVMKRYHCSLQDYLKVHDPASSTCLLLLAQLFEGVAHLVRNRVAHRDLKADNILLDLSEGFDCPRLVITDFGCCLADDSLGLRLPYYTDETAKGGNSALMAPEVACVRSGPYSTIDYSKADLWAAGALAYEILGEPNPFYRVTKDEARLDSQTFNEEDLPVLPEKAHYVIRSLVTDILQRDPKKRPDADVAANVCEILLFGPTEWLGCALLVERPSEREAVQWLVTHAAHTLLRQANVSGQRKVSRVQQQIAVSFLRRVQLNSLSAALQYIFSFPNK